MMCPAVHLHVPQGTTSKHAAELTGAIQGLLLPCTTASASVLWTPHRWIASAEELLVACRFIRMISPLP
jgi:hypothetical protein